MAELLKTIASSAVDESAEELKSVGSSLWNEPELAFEERHAHKVLTNFLEEKGFSVERSYVKETAFRATFGSGGPNVCVVCEYDALPGIGHGCGHNLIAEAGVAAAVGLKAAMESKGAPKAKLTVMGTPAEEGGAGKVYLIDNGAFDHVDFAMMVHPAAATLLRPLWNNRTQLEATYTGQTAHAAASPWEGVNALDAAVVAYTSVSVLRQQMMPDWRVHGIFTNGGERPNVIPDKATVLYYIRAPTKKQLSDLREKMENCFKSAAKATGCTVEIKEPAPTYDDVLNNPTLCEYFAKNWKTLGGEFDSEDPINTNGSTDMGNVSYKVPSIHPVFKIGLVPSHTAEFSEVANTPEAHVETLKAGKAMAHTCIDVLTTDGLLETIKEEFETQVAEAGADVPINVAKLGKYVVD